MMDIAQLIKQYALQLLGFANEQNIVEQLYLKALLDAFSRIDKNLTLEEKIRDALIRDLETTNELTKNHLEQKTIILAFESWRNVSNTEKSRADICFSISGFEFVIECKKLQFADQKYLEEGIKRFIELKYAEKDPFAGMLGFIMGGNPQKIIQNLKKKAKSYYPAIGMETALQQKVLNHPLSFQSKHLRLNQTEIHLYHIFFDFTKL